MRKAEEKHLTEDEIFRVISKTIERLNKSFDQCMYDSDKENAGKFLAYADGVRMLRDNMEYELQVKQKQDFKSR